MKEAYEKPTVQVEELEHEDVILTSESESSGDPCWICYF